MNIRLVYNFDFDLFKALFPDTELLDLEKDKNINIDLLIFPGGEDVSLEYYLRNDEIETYSPLCHVNKDRDDYESKILKKALSGKLNVNKILGICRGMQFLNVKFGGILFPDLATFDLQHHIYHDIVHKAENSLSFFKTVNSLHHQGLRYCGETYGDLEFYTHPKIIARDQSGYVIEIITWFDDKVLGIQFHPEYYDNESPDKIKFREVIYDWVLGRKKIYG